MRESEAIFGRALDEANRQRHEKGAVARPTLASVAKALGLPYAAVYRAVAATRKRSPETAALLDKALGGPPSEPEPETAAAAAAPDAEAETETEGEPEAEPDGFEVLLQVLLWLDKVSTIERRRILRAAAAYEEAER
jgi:hypothetical protein